jgi:hypothetical protein
VSHHPKWGGYLAWAPPALLLVVACSSSNSSSGSGALGCNGGFDAGNFFSGPVSESVNHQCGNGGPLGLKGTKQPGDACQGDEDCAPTCCACPSNANSAYVAWCNNGTCSTANDACCVFQYVQTHDFNVDGGLSGVCGGG